MSYVTAIYTGSPAQIDYRLGQQHGCATDQLGYRTDLRERPLEWIGTGFDALGPELAALGVAAGNELTEAHFDIARALVAGHHPVTGEALVTGKPEIYPDAKVSSKALVDAVHALAQRRHVSVASLLKQNAEFLPRLATMGREVRRKGVAAVTRADYAGQIARAAGLDPDEVWGAGVHATAEANLTEQRVVVDPVTGESSTVTMPRRLDIGIKAFDLEVDLPKSYSVLLALVPEATAAKLEAALADSVRTVFGWTEARTSFGMRGEHGGGKSADRIETAGFTAWMMIHRTARPVGDARFGDPHWHAHITIPNLVCGVDGQWSTAAAGGRDLMRHAPAIGKLTQAEARRLLNAEFGVTFERSERTGVWEVAAVPDATLRLFSKRGIQISALLEQLGVDPKAASAAEARILTRDSRSTKGHSTAAPDTTLREYWRAELLDARARAPDVHPHPDTLTSAALGTYFAAAPDVTQPLNLTAVLAAAATAPVTTVAAVAQALADPESGITASARRFSRLDALVRVADELPTGATPADVEAMTDLVLQHPAFVALPFGVASTGTAGERRPLGAAHMTDAALFTTADIVAAEKTILDRVAESRPAQRRALVDGQTLVLATGVVEAAQGFVLSAEQVIALATITGSGRALDTIQGEPGTGKTALMRAARVAWESSGYTVAGAATAAVAAQNLQTESGITSFSVASLLARIDRGRGLSGVDVLVIDEANLTDDRARARLYDHAEQCGTKVVEIGDPKQLRGVGCGSMFGYVHRLLDGPELTENRRQLDEDSRRILAEFRAGRYHEALRALAERGHLVATETGDEALAAMVGQWLRRADGAPDGHALADGLLMIAPTNAAVDRINAATQAAREALGQLGDGRVYAAGTSREARFHVGDQVLIRRNDRAEHEDGTERSGREVEGATVLNGYRGVVTDVGETGVQVRWRIPDGAYGTALASPSYIAGGGLSLGYAITGHKAEGLTVGDTWTRSDGTEHRGDVLIYAAGMDNPGAYVSLSRPRGDAVVFAGRADLEDERAELLHGPIDAADPGSGDVLTARVAIALANRAAATAETANDIPVHVDLGRAEADPASASSGHGLRADAREDPLGQEPAAAGAEQAPVDGERLDVSSTAMATRMARWREDFDRTYDHVDAAQVDAGAREMDVVDPVEPGEVNRVVQDFLRAMVALHEVSAVDDPDLAAQRQAEYDQRYLEFWDLHVRQDAARAAEPEQRASTPVAGERELPAALERFDNSRGHLAELAAGAAVEATGRDRLEIVARAAEARAHFADRPDGALSNPALNAKITALHTERAELAARLDVARQGAEQAEAKLRAGPGPKETEHAKQLVVLEQRAELASQVAAANTAIRDLEAQRLQARVQEMAAQRHADQAPWIRVDVRAAARTDIAAQQARQAELDAQVQPIREHRDALVDHLGGQTDVAQAVPLHDTAERHRERDQERARDADRVQVAAEHDRVSRTESAVDRIDRDLDRLTGERDQREGLAPGEARVEQLHRIGSQLGRRMDRRDNEIAVEHQPAARQIEHAPHLHDIHHHGPEQGHGLGMSR